MTSPLRVCVWATTFQASIYSFTKYLLQRGDTDVVVVTDRVKEYATEPLSVLRPLPVRLLEKDDPATVPYLLKEFRPDVTVVDNHHPPARLSPVLLNVWHGFGWRGPEDRAHFGDVFRNIRRITGRSGERENRFFRWISAGPTNTRYRIEKTGFAPENVVGAGQAFIDDIVKTDLTREEMLRFYPPAFAGKKVALFAPTWHFGRIFYQGESDLEILRPLFEKLARENVALIFRMHDRKRFERSYVEALETLVAQFPLVMLKYKDADRDNLVDMLVSDFMISNYSSILTYFYATGRPTIHVHPVDRNATNAQYRSWSRGGGLKTTKMADKSLIWALPPEEHGGLVVDTWEELSAAIDRALTDPACCEARAQAFIAKHCAPYDGRTSERVAAVMDGLVAEVRARPPRRFLRWAW